MANEPVITICGNATGDAELKFLPSGAAVASWTIASTPRVKRGDTWEDGETVFYRCSVWRQMAENAAETITRGMRLVVSGRFKVRTWEKDGEKRTSLEIDVEHVGPDLRYATATVKKADRSSEKPASAPIEDPWASVPPPAEEPPF